MKLNVESVLLYHLDLAEIGHDFYNTYIQIMRTVQFVGNQYSLVVHD